MFLICHQIDQFQKQVHIDHLQKAGCHCYVILWSGFLPWPKTVMSCGVWPRVVPGRVGASVKLRQPSSQHHALQCRAGRIAHRMIVQDISDIRSPDEDTMIVTGEFLTKMNYLLVLMAIIFSLLCLLLTVCMIMWVSLWRGSARASSSVTFQARLYLCSAPASSYSRCPQVLPSSVTGAGTLHK